MRARAGPAVVAVAAVASASVSIAVPIAAGIEAPGAAAQPAGGERIPKLLGAAAVAGANGLRPLDCAAQKYRALSVFHD